MSINVREFSALRMSPSAGQRMMESMTEQLSLFQIPDGRMAEGLAAAGPMPGESDFGPVDELFRCNRRWRSRCSFLELLEFIARLPAYSPLNAFLIHVQDPAATRVATARMWARKYQRRLLPGARPIVILAPMSPVLFVFDVRDTEGPPMTPVVFPAAGPAGRPVRLLDTVLHNCAIQRLAVREDAGIGPSTERAIRLTPAWRRNVRLSFWSWPAFFADIWVSTATLGGPTARISISIESKSKLPPLPIWSAAARGWR
ncbi:MAG: hypothetical protein MUC57_07750 [Desulfobacterales bacterium]|nr:hypothetical protein [Desulfobacterales bacterium]